MVRVAILGAGFMGRTHLNAYLNNTNAQVVAVADQKLKRAEELASLTDALAFSDPSYVIENIDVDLVDVVLPTPNHLEFVTQALEFGKNVIVEKPLALTLEDADRMISTAQKERKLLMVAHVLRFWPEYVAIRDLYLSGDLGAAQFATAYRLAGPPEWATWFHDPKKSGGAAVDLQIHDFDVMNWIFGKPSKITSSGVQSPQKGWNHVVSLVEYADASSSVEAGFMFPQKYPFTAGFRLLCENGAIEYHYRAGGGSFEQGQPVSYLLCHKSNQPSEEVIVDAKDAFDQEIAYFVDCVENQRSPQIVTAQDARLALQLSLASLESLETGLTVNL